LNILRDLPAVADLIEICFSDTMDSSGRSNLDEMRRHATDGIFLSWAPHVIDVISLPLSGFVWEDQGKVVGNASLIPFHRYGRRIYMIANVATHPSYRRRGIGHTLTRLAMQRAREKGADEIWLNVRDDNPGAIKIYYDLGFRERTRRTEWYAPSGALPRADSAPGAHIRPRAARDWEAQSNWLKRAYPEEINWYQQWPSMSAFGPSLLDKFYRLITDTEMWQWAIESPNGQLRGVISCQMRESKAPHAWLACPPNPDNASLTELLVYARRRFAHLGGVHLEYPFGPADAAIRAAGFSAKRTLIWMEAPGQQPNASSSV
jgi:ribosomal protein S18 acetylase RimI-like enzyme